MCGICGVVYSDGSTIVPLEMLKRMTRTMIHRGPDGEGFYHQRGIGLGIRRLSIIDLETGDQPISNENGTITVVCNGEIYNYKELRDQLKAKNHHFRTNSDVEVIVHLYEEYGLDCVNYLRGMFGFAIWDGNLRRLVLGRDRLGIKPLFYALRPDALLFGSELKSILESNLVDKTLDPHALNDLFSAGFIFRPKTLFQHIRRLSPGHILIYEKGQVSIREYWRVRFPAKRNFRSDLSARGWAEALRGKIEETVRLHLRSDVPLGAFLSSGVDSSAITSLMSQLYDQPVQTFSIAFENSEFDEVSSQKILSDFPEYRLMNQRTTCTLSDFDLVRKSVWHREDPTSIVIDIPLMLIAKESAKYVKAVLTGEGSDEIFGGYGWFFTHKVLGPYMKLPLLFRKIIANLPLIRNNRRKRTILAGPREMNLVRYKQLMHPGNPGFAESVFSDEVLRRISDEPSPPGFDLPEEFDDWHPFNQLQYFELTVRLPDFITRNLDSSSMAFSLEARVPFLDHELVEFCAQIPPNLKMRRFQEKHILRRAMQKDLPLEIARRKKRGLVPPVSQWISNLPDFARELLAERALRDKGYFKPEFVGYMLESYRAGNKIYDKSIMCVLEVQLWDDLFVKASNQYSPV